MMTQVTAYKCDGCDVVVRVVAPVAYYRGSDPRLRVGVSTGWCQTCGTLRSVESYTRDRDTYDFIIDAYSDDDQHPLLTTLDEWVVARELLAGKSAPFRCLGCGLPQEPLLGPIHTCGGTFHVFGLDLHDANNILEIDPPKF